MKYGQLVYLFGLFTIYYFDRNRTIAKAQILHEINFKRLAYVAIDDEVINSYISLLLINGVNQARNKTQLLSLP